MTYPACPLARAHVNATVDDHFTGTMIGVVATLTMMISVFTRKIDSAKLGDDLTCSMGN